MAWNGIKTVCDYFRSARDMLQGKSVEESVEDKERTDAIEHDNELEEAEERIKRLEQQLNEAKAELVRIQEQNERFEETLPDVKPSEPPVKREAKYFLKKWQRTCLWYGSVITLTVAVLWFGVLFVNWNEWWRIWPEPYISCPIKILMRLLEYTLLYVLVRLSFCWLFFPTAYDDPSTRDDVYMKLERVREWRFVMAFWNNAVLSTINFYRGVLKSRETYKYFVVPGIKWLRDNVSRRFKGLFK